MTMNKEAILGSVALKKKFCRDCSLPIMVFDNPYFMERLAVIDRLFHCIESFDVFCDELKQFANEQDYFTYYNRIKDEIITFIRSQPGFIKFCNQEFRTNTVYQKRNLYIDGNDDAAYISIDMKNANFSALKYYDPEIFAFADSWESFVGRFTNSLHIQNSKYIRQVVLGACNPKHQIQYERVLMSTLLNHIVSKFPQVSVYSLGEDEIILNVVNGCGFSLSDLKGVIANCPGDIGKLVRVEMFELSKIDNPDGWLKSYYSFGTLPYGEERIEFKCINAETFHCAVKKYYNEPIIENDLVFYHNGRLARFIEGMDG